MGAYKTNMWHFKVLISTSFSRRTRQKRPNGGYCSWSLMWQRLDGISVSANSLLSVLLLCLSSLKCFLFPPVHADSWESGDLQTKAEYRFCAEARGGKYQSPLWKVSWKHERRSVPDLFTRMCQNPYLHKHMQGCARTHSDFDVWSHTLSTCHTKHLSHKPDLVTHVRIAQVQILHHPVE